MSTRIFTRLRSTICGMVLLALFATLLPAHHASAQQNIVLSEQEVREQIYIAWVNEQRNNGQQGSTWTEGVTRDLIVMDQMLVDGSLDPDVVLKEADALKERYMRRLGPRGTDPAYRASLPVRVTEEAMYAAALESPNFRESARRVYERKKIFAPNSLETAQSAGARAYYQTYIEGDVLNDAYRTLLDEKLDRAVARAETDEKFVKAWDAVFEPFTGVKLENFDARTFLAEHPDASVPQLVRDSIRPDGSMEISLADLQNLARDEFGKINASIDDMQKTLVTLSTQQGELVDFMRNQQARQQAQALAEAKAKEHQLKLQAANSAVYIVSALVGLKDPMLGKQIATVGQSLIKIGESLNGWMQAVSGLNTLSKLTSLSTVVMTGNVLGAVLNIYSLFAPQQPTPEQLILEEIGKLRQQVNELRTEMHTRFDQVDKQLNTIYTTMHERFNQIDIKLGKINGSLAEIQQSLLTLGMTLNRIERNNFEYFDTLGRRPLREAMNGALDYQQRTGLEMPYQPEFVNYENIFHSWGTVNAFDALSAGPTQRDYSDGQVLAELSAAPLDANLNYLNGWLVAHGMQPFASQRLPSPRDWAFASRAYAQLGLDWPGHLRRIDSQRQASLDAVGNDLEQAMQNISTIDTPVGPQGNAPLFSGLTAYYNSKLQALDNALAASEAAFVNEVRGSLQRQAPFELYGGLDQFVADEPNDFKTMTCGGSDPHALATPRSLKNMVADYNRFALADYLQVSPVKVCVEAGWVNVDPPCVAGPGTCERRGELLVYIVVWSGDKVVLVRRSIRGQRTNYSEANIWELLAPEWESYWKRLFQVMFVNQATPPPLSPEATRQLESVSSALASKLAELQRAHANRVLGELTRGPVQASAVELAGAKKLLESFIILGMPQAISSDDLLRSLLFSNEALIDNQQIASVYAPPALSATGVPSEAQLMSNPRARLRQTGQKRHDALAKLMTDYLGGISTENHREDNALIAGTRFDMLMAQTFSGSGAPRPGQNQFIFLPLLRR